MAAKAEAVARLWQDGIPAGTTDWDVVYVRDFSGGLQECYAKEPKQRQITVGGRACDHVAEQAGIWVYEMRRD